MSDMNFYIHKRPGVEEFIKQMAKQYELVVFTASQYDVSDTFVMDS